MFLFFNKNICCEYSKEPSRLKLIGKKILTILCSKIVFIIFSQVPVCMDIIFIHTAEKYLTLEQQLWWLPNSGKSNSSFDDISINTVPICIGFEADP